jgi:hypothetical protein
MSITSTVGDGFYVTYIRRGERMRKRCHSTKEAEICLKSMMEDTIVDTNYTRWYFLPDKTLILHKPKMCDPKYKNRYLV